MNAWGVVFRKEMLDALRDRRSVMAALVYSLVGPLAIGLAINLIAQRETDDGPLTLSLRGAEAAPGLAEFLEQNGVTAVAAGPDAEVELRAGRIDLLAIVDPDYPADLSTGRPATVRLLHDASRSASRNALRRAETQLAAYSRRVASARLMARGLSSSMATPLQIERLDLSTPRTRAAVVLQMLPIFLLVGAFVGGMNIAIDVSAGERERSSLEPLLVTSAPVSSIVLGKWLAAVAFSLFGIGAGLAFMLVVLQGMAPKMTGLAIPIQPRDALPILACLAPLALFASGLQMLTATFSRSYKEAQTYLSLLLFLPMVPGFLISFSAVGTAEWMKAMPVLGQQVLLSTMMRGEAAGVLPLAAAGAITLFAAVVCTYATGRLLAHERIILAR